MKKECQIIPVSGMFIAEGFVYENNEKDPEDRS